MLALLCGVVMAAKPNVIVIMADDIGFGDLSCYGASKVKTPNIDKLAKSGIRFTDAHSPATVCTPTRFALLTGQYSFRERSGSQILPGDATLSINPSLPTMPKMFQTAGYKTAVIGKWHLGLGDTTPDFNKPISKGANSVGFDYSYIIPATGDRVPCVFVENGNVVNLDPKDPITINYRARVGEEPIGLEKPELLKIKPVQGHLGTVINGVSRIGFMSGGKKARWVDEDIADVITKRATDFIAKNRAKPFFLYFATHDAHAPILPHKRFVGKSQHGIRGDAIMELDWSVGEVMKSLEKHRLTKNTVVIFTSDNGGVTSDGYQDDREQINGHSPNGVLRGTKYTLYEGGHRIPFIVSWPGTVSPSQESSALLCQVDLFASFGAKFGLKSGGMDSESHADAFFGVSSKGRDSLVHHLGGFGSPLAFRKGKWVIVPKQNKTWELYDLDADIAQTNNLAQAEPERVAQMVSELEAIKARS